MLSKEEHKMLLDSLVDPGADIIGLSLILMDNYDSISAEQETVIDPELENAMQILTMENQKLRAQNTELFLRLGKPTEETEQEEKEPEEVKPVTYEDIGV